MNLEMSFFKINFFGKYFLRIKIFSKVNNKKIYCQIQRKYYIFNTL